MPPLSDDPASQSFYRRERKYPKAVSGAYFGVKLSREVSKAPRQDGCEKIGTPSPTRYYIRSCFVIFLFSLHSVQHGTRRSAGTMRISRNSGMRLCDFELLPRSVTGCSHDLFQTGEYTTL
jgi:hypothetical protein